MNLEQYVRRYLRKELAFVKSSPIAMSSIELDVFEKTLIFYYTSSGYRSINASMRRSFGKQGNRAAVLLREALIKLPDWRGPVFRATRLTKSQIAAYQRCALSGTIITESAFFSTSRSPHKLNHYPNTNVTYHIYARHGKRIEDYSHLGRLLPPNEEEILLLPESRFWVLDVNESDGKVLIVMEQD